MYNEITIAITSCWRIDLLKKTIQSIELTIDLSKYNKVITEDSRDKETILKIKEANNNGFLKGWKVIFTQWSKQKDVFKCHYYALKELYRNIDTKYVFHCEDDLIFKKTPFDYINLSYKILEANKHIKLILLRDLFTDFKLKKTWIMQSRYYEILTDKHQLFFWHEFIYLTAEESFSLQPWLREVNTMKQVMFNYEDYVDEKLVSNRLSNLWYESIVIKDWIYNHLNPIIHSTRNIQNMWLLNYLFTTIKWTVKYRTSLTVKYIKNIIKKISTK